MKNFGRARPLVAGLLFIPLVVPAFSQKPVTLRHKFKAGVVETYSMRSNMEIAFGPSGTMKMATTARLTYAYKKVDRKGVATVAMRVDRIEMKMVPSTGRKPSMPEAASGTFTIDPTGVVSDFSLDAKTKQEMGPSMGLLSQIGGMQGFGAKLPDKPVRRGDTWRIPLPSQLASLGLGGGAVRQKFLGETTMGTVRVYDILSEGHIPIDGLKMPGAAKSGKGSEALSGAKGSITIKGHTYLRRSDCSLQSVKLTESIHMVVDTGSKEQGKVTSDTNLGLTMTRTK